MYKYFFTFILSFLISKTYQVIDESNNFIPYVQIYNTNLGIGLISDTDGYFNIHHEECIDLNIEHIGFQKKIINTCSNLVKIKLIKSPISSQEVSVFGDLGESKLKDAISDIEIISKNNITNSNKDDLSDILKSSTNLTYSALHSRAKYFQIRGVGEIEQFIGQGGPNYYVGTILDGINLSGIGMPIFMFDVEQVEIFKGAQSFAFGQNAMAGLIQVNTVKPKSFPETKFSLNIGNYRKRNVTFIHNQPINDNTAFRLSLAKNQEDGFIYNNYHSQYLNGKDELISNFKVYYYKILNSEDFLNFTYTNIYSDLENGNDRWSHNNFNNLDGSNFITETDFIGRDSFFGKSNALKVSYKKRNFYTLDLILTKSKNEMNYDYDGDWSNSNHWYNLYNDPNSISFSQENTDAFGYYNFPIHESRKRNDNGFELRLSKSFSNNDFILGIFNKTLTEDDHGVGFIFDLGAPGFVDNYKTNYKTEYSSIYYQHQFKLNENSILTLNLRNDYYDNNFKYSYTIFSNTAFLTSSYINSVIPYNFSNSIQSFRVGAKLYDFYISVSRGHKAGGINLSPSTLSYNTYIHDENDNLILDGNQSVSVLNNNDRTYNPEKNLNIDIGYSKSIAQLFFDLKLFYMNRKDVQVKIQDQIGDCATCYMFITKNVTDAFNIGLDFESSFKFSPDFSVFLNLGLLNTERAAYSYTNYEGVTQQFAKRELSSAPKWSLNSGIEYNFNNLIFLRYDISAKDSYFYYDDKNDKSSITILHNINSRFKVDRNFHLIFWIKNLTNEVYPAHIYEFSLGTGLNEQKWKSPTEPITYGVKLDFNF